MSEPIKVLSKELLRWIDRACEAEALIAPLSVAKGELMCRVQFAEARVAELEKVFVREKQADKAYKWGLEVGAFLKETLDPPFLFEMGEASRLFTDGIALGIIPEPDCRPGKEWQIKPGDGCGCPPVPESSICPKCGGRKI